MKKAGIFALMVVLMMSSGLSATAQSSDLEQKMKDLGTSLGEAASELGRAAGDKLGDWGDQLKAFSEDPDGYIDQNEFLSTVRNKANEAGQSLKEYWPTFKEALVGSAKTVIDSDMSWNDKKRMLKQYAQLAIPYLEEIEFASKRDEAKGAMELSVVFIQGVLDADEAWTQKQALLTAYEEQMGEFVSTLVAQANDESLDAAHASMTAAIQSQGEIEAIANLDQCKQQLEAAH